MWLILQYKEIDYIYRKTLSVHGLMTKVKLICHLGKILWSLWLKYTTKQNNKTQNFLKNIMFQFFVKLAELSLITVLNNYRTKFMFPITFSMQNLLKNWRWLTVIQFYQKEKPTNRTTSLKTLERLLRARLVLDDLRLLQLMKKLKIRRQCYSTSWHKREGRYLYQNSSLTVFS